VPDRNYVFVSDLHLSEGRLPGEQYYHKNEDFYYDEEFAKFLRYLEKEREDRSYKNRWRLVINGDFLDFLQVTTAPDPDDPQAVAAFKEAVEGATGKEYEEGDLEIRRKEYRLGLRFDAPKSVWKLARIMEGHLAFFDAIGEFLAAGNELLIIKGNHDAEFHYPEVRDYFRKMIDYLADDFQRSRPEGGGRRPTGRNRKKADAVSKRVFFSRWFYYEDGLFYAEHGGQYDMSNRYTFFLDPTIELRDSGLPTIRFPFGSFFVRYFFNELEEGVPLSDNIKSRLKVFIWILCNKAVYGLLKVRTLWYFITGYVWRKARTDFDHRNFLDWLKAKRKKWWALFLYVTVYPAVKIYLAIKYCLGGLLAFLKERRERGLWGILCRIAEWISKILQPDPAQYLKYKLRNFFFMFEVEGTNGIMPENGADTGRSGLSIYELLKIYYRSFKERAINEKAWERKLKVFAQALERLAELKRNYEKNKISEKKGGKDTGIPINEQAKKLINMIVSEAGSAASGKPYRKICSVRGAHIILSAVILTLGVAGFFIRRPLDTQAALLGALTLIIAVFIIYIIRDFSKAILAEVFHIRPGRYLNQAADGLARIVKAPFIILGHTHVAYTRPTESKHAGNSSGLRQWEVNTGSWTKVVYEKMMLWQTAIDFPFFVIMTEPQEIRLGAWDFYLAHSGLLNQPSTIRAGLLCWDDLLGEARPIRPEEAAVV
jgi:UDP-2,3-diacylglucosamine pyrophosphatase LpxH